VDECKPLSAGRVTDSRARSAGRATEPFIGSRSAGRATEPSGRSAIRAPEPTVSRSADRVTESTGARRGSRGTGTGSRVGR